MEKSKELDIIDRKRKDKSVTQILTWAQWPNANSLLLRCNKDAYKSISLKCKMQLGVSIWSVRFGAKPRLTIDFIKNIN